MEGDPAWGCSQCNNKSVCNREAGESKSEKNVMMVRRKERFETSLSQTLKMKKQVTNQKIQIIQEKTNSLFQFPKGTQY